LGCGVWKREVRTLAFMVFVGEWTDLDWVIWGRNLLLGYELVDK
jgi:hypothetical protein